MARARKTFDKTLKKNQEDGAKYFLVLSNRVRLLILEVLNKNRDGLILSELQSKINDLTKHEFGLSSIFDHIKVLQDHKLVKTKRLWGERGQPRVIRINEEILPVTLGLGKIEHLIFGK